MLVVVFSFLSQIPDVVLVAKYTVITMEMQYIGLIIPLQYPQ